MVSFSKGAIMALARRQFSKEFKLQVLRELAAGKTLAQLAREYEVHAGTIIGWRRSYEQYADQAFPGNGKAQSEEAKIAELERKIGQLTMENDLLKKAMTRLDPRDPRHPRAGGNGSGR
jgi:transposase